MALINRPMTEDEARELVASWRRTWHRIPSFYDMLANREPTPHTVVYDGKKMRYIAPDRFWFGPEVSVWIVPGTHGRKK